jgi:casein kinase 1
MFGTIYKGQNNRTQEYVAIKVEPITSPFKLLVRESKIYHYLQGCDGIPNIKWFGKDNVNYYMVLNLLGESLQDRFDREGPFSLATTMQVGIRIMSMMRRIHEKGLLHRDLKPDNFLFSHANPTEFAELYLIDFGLCKSYLDSDRRHIPMKHIAGVIGSLRFCSLAVHRRQELCRRDDLESICYMLFYLYTGKLPWSQDAEESIVFAKKQTLPTASCPPFFSELITRVRQTPFSKTPDYVYLIQCCARIPFPDPKV